MESPTSSNGAAATKPDAVGMGPISAVMRSIRTRVVSGLVLSLPIVLTFWILYWLYTTLQGFVLGPMAWLYRDIEGRAPSPWWDRVAAPAIAVFLIVAILYLLGLFVRSSLLRVIDAVLLHVPVVTTIYNALSNVARSLGNQMQSDRCQRVVLVEFPHPGMRALAFVTNTLQDSRTGKTILCVCVLTGVVPPAGFTLFVPEDSVNDVGWTVNQSLQAILSGGITTPASIDYFESLHIRTTTGPIVDPTGNPIERLQETGEATQT